MVASSTFPAGKRIVFTGRLASMSRSAAVDLVISAGGIVRCRVSCKVDAIVIGADGWPLRSSGRLTRNLQRADLLEREGHAIDIMGETEFLRRLTCDREVEHIRRTHTLEQLSRLLGISGLRIRRWIEQGLLVPRNESEAIARFDFGEVAIAKTLSQIVRRGTTLTTIIRSLGRLRRWLPNDARVAEHLVRLQNQLLVRDESNQLIEPNGQIQFAFDLDDPLAICVEESALADAPLSIDADRLFDAGFQHENLGRMEAAIAVYRNWLSLFGDDSDVLFNLGNVHVACNQIEQAVKCYRRCVRVDAQRAEAWNNLGLCLARLDDLSGTLQALRKAIEINPDYMDACYNLADVLDEAGCESEARLLWLRVVRRQHDLEMTQYARQRLDLSTAGDTVASPSMVPSCLRKTVLTKGSPL